MDDHPQARFIVETLNRAGFIAYYAGGWVRDYLLQHPSDDIDIATNAPPETIQALFSHTVPIGISFGILLVIIEGHQYEVATFRQDLDYQDGRRPSRIEFATAQEDAKRRDFTINGMFYDPIREELLDFVNGKEDLEKKIIRAIGNPHERIREDRLRMIRAIRLACRFHFKIEEKTSEAIRSHASELFPSVAIERVWQEFQKGLNFGHLKSMLEMLHEYTLLEAIFPELKNLGLPSLKKRLDPINRFPKSAPLIAYLLQLFPNETLNHQLDLCKKLKVSKATAEFTTLLYRLYEMLKKPKTDDVEWAYFFAEKGASTILQIVAAQMDEPERSSFLQTREDQKKGLHLQIDRIVKNDPLVKAADLIEEGVAPGKRMGALLKEAEKIAIVNREEDKKTVLQLLFKSPLWENG